MIFFLKKKVIFCTWARPKLYISICIYITSVTAFFYLPHEPALYSLKRIDFLHPTKLIEIHYKLSLNTQTGWTFIGLWDVSLVLSKHAWLPSKFLRQHAQKETFQCHLNSMLGTIWQQFRDVWNPCPSRHLLLLLKFWVFFQIPQIVHIRMSFYIYYKFHYSVIFEV